ncbi:SDR family oxidoreductase [Flexivirga lutea]
MGLHAAVELARRGVVVLASMRDPRRAGRLEEVAERMGVRVTVCPLDVTGANVERQLQQIIQRYGEIDILVNNAGRGSVGTAEDLTMAQIRAQLEVNYLGPVRLTKILLPRMRELGSGTILTVTSVGGVVGQPFADAYCGAKFAVEGFMQSLSTVAAQFGVRVGVIEPAAVASSFVASIGQAAATGPYEELLAAYLARTRRAFHSAQSEVDAGYQIADAALSEDFVFRRQTSDAARRFAAMSLGDLDGSRVWSATKPWIQPGGETA